MLRLARQWEINACARWALFHVSFGPQQEIKAKLGDGWTIHIGPYLMTMVLLASIFVYELFGPS